MAKDRVKQLSPAFRLVIIYIIFSIIWVLSSDFIAASVAGNDKHLLLKIEDLDGIVFVVISGLLWLFISRRLYQNLYATLKSRNELLNKFVALNEATGEAVVDHDLISDKAVINEQMKYFLGTESNLVHDFSETHKARIHPDDTERVIKNFKDFLTRKNVMWQSNYRFKVQDGTYRDIVSRGYVIREEKSGKPLHMIQAIQDITEIRNIKAVYYEQQTKNRQAQAKSIIKAQESERNRWAEELHDNVCQMLTVAKLLLDQVTADEKHALSIATSQKMVTTALEEIRQLSAAMKPPRFADTTLEESIKELIANISRIKKLQFTVSIDQRIDSRLNDDQKIMIYRVIQEQLSNIIKYAKAKNIMISIQIKNNEIWISIKDDGIGFDPEKIKNGIGLKNIRSRLQVFSGNFRIISAPGSGCELIACFCLA
jgi:two-component system sensor histidine kinase UhpB